MGKEREKQNKGNPLGGRNVNVGWKLLWTCMIFNFRFLFWGLYIIDTKVLLVKS